MNKLSVLLLSLLVLMLLVFSSYITTDIRDRNLFMQPYFPDKFNLTLQRELNLANYNLTILKNALMSQKLRLEAADDEVLKVGAITYQLDKMVEERIGIYKAKEEQFFIAISNLKIRRRQVLDIVGEMGKVISEPYMRRERLTYIRDWLIKAFSFNEDELAGWIIE